MTTRSVSFDSAAEVYNATRGFPPGVGAQMAEATVALLGPAARVLEIGIGTGRIALPLTQRGLRISGVDLSRRMMGRLREGLAADGPAPALAEADAARLPFASASFEAVMAVHVFHLIAGWREALGEARRCLRPGGPLLLGYDWHPLEGVSYQMRLKWAELLRAAGVRNQPGAPGIEAVREALLASGAGKDELIMARWSRTHTIGEHLDNLQRRLSSSTWSIPEDVFQRLYADIESWALSELGARDAPHTVEFRFVWERYRWAG